MPRMLRLVSAVVVAALMWPGAAVAGTSLSLNASTVGPPGSNKAGELTLPHTGTPPYPAVIVLHGCNGVSRHVREVAARLAGWGYAALVVDSFRPRGFENVCNRGKDFSGGRRVADVFAAADYLRSRKDIDPNHIGALGISHGAWTVLYAAMASVVVRQNAKPLQAIVAYYPWCFPHPPPFMTDVQIFIGGADDWTPARRCVDMLANYPKAASHRPLLKIYPGATHAFDSAARKRVYFGHHMEPDPSATKDSNALSRKFLDARLHH
jgi:dienelactone hydrolase